MKLRLSNYNKPSEPLLKNIANGLLYFLSAELLIIPTLPVTDNSKFWITFGLTQVTILVKIISQFTIDPKYIEQDVVHNSTEVDKDNS